MSITNWFCSLNPQLLSSEHLNTKLMRKATLWLISWGFRRTKAQWQYVLSWVLKKMLNRISVRQKNSVTERGGFWFMRFLTQVREKRNKKVRWFSNTRLTPILTRGFLPIIRVLRYCRWTCHRWKKENTRYSSNVVRSSWTTTSNRTQRQ